MEELKMGGREEKVGDRGRDGERREGCRDHE